MATGYLPLFYLARGRTCPCVSSLNIYVNMKKAFGKVTSVRVTMILILVLNIHRQEYCFITLRLTWDDTWVSHGKIPIIKLIDTYVFHINKIKIQGYQWPGF